MKIKANGQIGKKVQTNLEFKSWDINAALRDIYDLGERIQLFPLMLGDVAKQIHDNQDIMMDVKVNDKIEWGIHEKNMTPEVISLFKTWNFKPNDRGWEYTFENIPIQIVVIKRKYKFFDNPDQKFYKVDEYKIPNPFESYWKARYLIR